MLCRDFALLCLLRYFVHMIVEIIGTRDYNVPDNTFLNSICQIYILNVKNLLLLKNFDIEDINLIDKIFTCFAWNT